jgi:hypothetical protein
MTYFKQFVASIKTNNKILRETRQSSNSAEVSIPFASEYSILMKNLSTQKAQVKITIDGVDVLGGRALIVNPNDDFELERFVSSLKEGNKFRFIEKTAQISDFRGDKVDDGVVRIEYQFEKKVEWVNPNGLWITNNWNNGYGYDGLNHRSYYDNIRVGSPVIGDCINTVYASSVADSVNYCAPVTTTSAEQETKTCGGMLRSMSFAAPSEDGITVQGSASSQKFARGSIGALEEEKHVITLMLRGKSGEEVVEKPITVNLKSQCPTCGMKFRGFPKFCSNCSTAMTDAQLVI